MHIAIGIVVGLLSCSVLVCLAKFVQSYTVARFGSDACAGVYSLAAIAGIVTGQLGYYSHHSIAVLIFVSIIAPAALGVGAIATTFASIAAGEYAKELAERRERRDTKEGDSA